MWVAKGGTKRLALASDGGAADVLAVKTGSRVLGNGFAL